MFEDKRINRGGLIEQPQYVPLQGYVKHDETYAAAPIEDGASKAPRGVCAPVGRWNTRRGMSTNRAQPPKGGTLVASNAEWELWERVNSQGSTWQNWKLICRVKGAIKVAFWIGWHKGESRFAHGNDAKVLMESYPEIGTWVAEVASGRLDAPVPKVKVLTHAEKWEAWRQKRDAERGYTKRDIRNAQARRRYERERQESMQRKAAVEIPLGAEQLVMRELAEAWEAKRPYSMRRAAPVERQAAKMLRKRAGVDEDVLQDWIVLQVKKGRIAEEMFDKRNRTKGLKPLENKAQEAETPAGKISEV